MSEGRERRSEERTWMSSWRRWYGSSVIESFCPEQRRTDRSCPPKIFVMGDSRVSVCSHVLDQLPPAFLHPSPTHGPRRRRTPLRPHLKPLLRRPTSFLLRHLALVHPINHDQDLIVQRIKEETQELLRVLLVPSPHRIEALVRFDRLVHLLGDERVGPV